jgi:hypothetical protein
MITCECGLPIESDDDLVNHCRATGHWITRATPPPMVVDHAPAVDHPAHYGGDSTYETIKVIEAWGLDFALGNAVKYISRAGKKDATKTLEDLEKARWYLDRRIAQLKTDK